METTTLRHTLAALALAGATLIGSQARAELPPLSCGVYEIAYRYGGTEPLGFCVAFEHGKIFAGMKNLSSTRHFFRDTAQVELVYYAFDQFPHGGNVVLEKTYPVPLLYGDEVRETRRRADHWFEGVYCARLYEPGFWPPADLHCVDTNGHVHR